MGNLQQLIGKSKWEEGGKGVQSSGMSRETRGGDMIIWREGDTSSFKVLRALVLHGTDGSLLILSPLRHDIATPGIMWFLRSLLTP